MKSMKKLGLALGLAATVIAAPAFASNTNTSTARTIRTDVDNYIDVRFFDEVEFETIFATTNFGVNSFDLGVAKKFGDIYVAGKYEGAFWNALYGKDVNKDTTTTNEFVEDATKNNNEKELSKDSLVKNNGVANTQSADVLIGLPNLMGLKLDTYLNFNSSDQKYNYKDSKYNTAANGLGNKKESSEILNEGSKSDSVPTGNGNEKSNYNSYNFGLTWACFDLDLGKVAIKPWAKLGVNVYDNTQVITWKDGDKTLVPDYAESNVDTLKTYNKKDFRNGYTAISANLASDFEFKNSETVNSMVYLNYYLFAPIFPNDLSVAKTNYVNNLDSKDNWSEEVATKRSGKVQLNNTLNAAYKFEAKPITGLTIAASAGVSAQVNYRNPGKFVKKTTRVNTANGSAADKKNLTTVTEDFGYYNSSNGEVQGSTDIEYVNGKAQPTDTYTSVDYKEDIVTTSFSPSFALGLSYAVKPNFVVNFGYAGTIPSVTIESDKVSKTTTTTTYTNKVTKEVNNVNKEVANTNTVTTYTGNYTGTLSAGFAWNFAKYCTLDVAADNFFTSNKTSLNNMWTANWSLGFTFKK